MNSQPFRSQANSLPGANRLIGPWPICSLELLLPGTFAPSPALSLSGTFIPLVYDTDMLYSLWLYSVRCRYSNDILLLMQNCMHCAKGDFPHAQYALYLHAIHARRVVKCGTGAVTWRDDSPGQSPSHCTFHSAFYFPHSAHRSCALYSQPNETAFPVDYKGENWQQ